MPRCGKKVTMMLLSVPIFAGWLCLILADTVWLIYLGRYGSRIRSLCLSPITI